MNSGLILPGRTRTRPLNIQLSRPLSGVVEAMCGSSLPASAEPMPTARLFFCAKAGGANISAAHTMPNTIFFIDCPPVGNAIVDGMRNNMRATLDGDEAPGWRKHLLSVQGEFGRRRQAAGETSQPESRKIMPRNTSEREIGA